MNCSGWVSVMNERTLDRSDGLFSSYSRQFWLFPIAHCLHNIGVVFDMKKEYNRSLPHYEEALAIKNAVAGFAAKDCMSLVEQIDPDESRALVLQSLHEDHEFPRINKATLSASVTRQKIAAVYANVSCCDCGGCSSHWASVLSDP